ncbi:hypothetical protein BD769DRAFT_1713675 [Suillus cothurnatus]|nr:hypothetical protein BD769DRAFT_1713675 [Suillus cothurnatus]
MAPKGGNAKKESGRAKKAENEAKKQDAAAADKAKKEAEKWEDGAKGNKAKEEKEAKRLAELARKAENARLLAEEEAAPAKAKPAPKKKKDVKPAGPGAIAAGSSSSAATPVAETNPKDEPPKEIESYAATGIDDALDLLERRFKAAFEAYKERELPNLKEEHPGLRLQQYQDLLHKQFQKSPDNPFNQVTIAYDATKDEKLQSLKEKQDAVQKRLRA